MPAAGGQTIAVRRIILHPGWKSPQTNVVDDIALLELEHPAQAQPVSIYRRRDEAGRTVTFVGHGATGNGRDGVVRGSPLQLRKATNAIDEASDRWLVFRFDEPGAATDLEGISGPGDSGGPAFLTIDGRTSIAGVSSWQDNRKQGKEGLYGVVEYYARVSSYAGWIDETIGNLVLRGTLWDGLSDEVVKHAAVVIHDGRIAAIERDSGEDSGLFILPGLVDNHVHVLDRLLRNRGETAAGLRRWLCSGVTTLVDNGSTLEALRQFRSSPPADVPRIFAAGPIFTAPDGYPFGSQAAADSAGADFFKAAIERGFLSDVSDDGWPIPDAATLAGAVKAAHDRGIIARAHVTQRHELERALDAGFDSLAHVPIDPLSEETLLRSRAANVVFVSTLHLWAADADRAAAARLLELASDMRREDAPASGQTPFKGLHYFDLTEDIATTRRVTEIAENAARGQVFTYQQDGTFLSSFPLAAGNADAMRVHKGLAEMAEDVTEIEYSLDHYYRAHPDPLLLQVALGRDLVEEAEVARLHRLQRAHREVEEEESHFLPDRSIAAARRWWRTTTRASRITRTSTKTLLP